MNNGALEDLLSRIYDTQLVTTVDGVDLPLNSAVDREEGEFLSSIIRERGFLRTLEVGCAYGISALHICGALANASERSHTLIDPNQSAEWSGVGAENLRRANVDFFELIEEPSEVALPKLLGEGFRCEFAFIDGWHTFDHALVDFFYINRMLDVGGVVAFDDVDYASIEKLVRFVARIPCYSVLGCAGKATPKPVRQRLLRSFMGGVSWIMPKRLSRRILRDELVHSSRALGVNGTVVALEKTAEDRRSYDWFEEF